MPNFNIMTIKLIPVTLIIPFYNEAKRIASTIKCLKSQTVLADEIFFTDSGSDDHTVNIIKDSNINFEYAIDYSRKMSPGSSLNYSIKKSKNELIAYMDVGKIFPDNWLEKQYETLTASSADYVSAVITTKGSNIVDQSFIAQLYGRDSSTACLTGSLMKKSIVERLNYFIEDTRATFDIDFMDKCKKLDYKRIINHDIVMSYSGINFANTYTLGFKKIFSYSLTGWRTSGYKKHYYYTAFIILSALFYYLSLLSLFFSLYIITRGFLLPIFKSASWIEILKPKLLINTIMAGIIIDCARIFGYSLFFLDNK